MSGGRGGCSNGRNILLNLAYDGTSYVGWQRQPSFQGTSVQQTVEQALGEILGHPVSVTGAGRTDAGVHALGQRCNFFCDKPVPIEKLAEIINHRLPPDVSVSRAQEVPPDFHARFAAQSKHYRYIIERGALPSAFGGRFTWQIEDEPDVPAMRQGAELLIGEHDFRHFTVSGNEAKTSVRTLFSLEISEPEALSAIAPLPTLSRPLVLDVRGNGFLYKMVRIITGRLLALGRGQLSLDQFAAFLGEGCDKNIPPAPAKGLTLMEVGYGDQI